MEDFDFMTQNSNLIKFDMDFIIEMVNLEFLKKCVGTSVAARVETTFFGLAMI